MNPGDKITLTLAAGYVLTLTVPSGATGTITRLSDSAGGEPYSPVALNGSDLSFGPFASPRRYAVAVTKGVITYADAPADPVSEEEGTTNYATAAQGATADTALQPADVGTAAAEDVGYFATAAQGATADAAVPTSTLATLLTSGAGAPDDAVQATLSRNPAGDDNALTFTAVAYGTGGNSITITYADPAAISAALSVAVVANDITVNLATDAGTAASLSVNPAGDDNALTFTAVAAGPAGDNISITYVDPAAIDQTLSVAVVGTDITVNLATDGAGAITSTAALVKSAIEASGPAAALVTVAIDASDTGVADDGSGVVTAMALANLANGANGAITSTAALVLAAIEASGPASALVTVAIDTGDTGVADDGSGVVTALASAPMTGGAGTSIGVSLKGGLYIDTTGGLVYRNSGTQAVPVWTALADVP